MPGGIGPVDQECAKALCLNHRAIRLPACADEVQIFYNLSMDRVHYIPARNAIYFVESSHVALQTIILSVMHSLGVRAGFDQLHLDKSGIFKGGKRLTLPPEQAVALRLKGIQISVSR